MKKENILNIVASAVGVITAILVKTVMSPCMGMVTTESGNQMPMRCHYAGVALFLVAILAVVIGIDRVITNKKCTLAYMGLMVVIILIFNGTVGIGICLKSGMMCSHTKTLGIISAVIWGIIGLMQFFIKGEKDI